MLIDERRLLAFEIAVHIISNSLSDDGFGVNKHDLNLGALD